MSRLTTFKTTSALAFVCFASPAFADLSAEDAWEKFQSFGALYGGVIGSESVQSTGSGLSVTNPHLTIANPDFQLVIDMPDMLLNEMGDGTVSIDQPETGTFKFTIGSSEGTFLAVLGYEMPDAVQVISGTADEMTYDFDVPKLLLTLEQATLDGETGPVGGTIDLSGYTGSYTISSGDLMRVAGDINLARVAIDVKAWDEDGDGKLSVNAAYSGINGQSTGAMPAGMTMMDPKLMNTEGFFTKSRYSTEGGTLTFDFAEGSDKASGELSSQGGAGALEITSESLSYDLSGKGVSGSLSGSEIPLPVISFGLEDWAFKLATPTAKSEGDKEIALRTRLGGLTVNDMVWMMIDPAGALPHDPATAEIDLTGTGKLFFDLFDPDSLMTMESKTGMPAELNTLIVNKLLLSIAGAELSGLGGFVFDNTDLATFGGIPRPEGKLDLKLTGGNTLLDKLVNMGLVPGDQAMGARMMLGLFARPGDGPDTLVSTIEVTPEGALMANGQRLK